MVGSMLAAAAGMATTGRVSTPAPAESDITTGRRFMASPRIASVQIEHAGFVPIPRPRPLNPRASDTASASACHTSATGRLWPPTLAIVLLAALGVLCAIRYRGRARALALEIEKRATVEQALRDLNRTLEAQVVERTREVRREHAELLEAQRRLDEGARQLRQAQKMEAFGQLAGGIAHDFNNMLVAIMGTVEMALAELEDGPSEQLRDDLVEIRRVGRMAADLTRQLLAFSRQQNLAPRPIEVNALVQDVGMMARRILDVSVELCVETSEAASWALMDPTQLEQVLVNLILNARDAMPEGGALRLRVDRTVVNSEAPAGELLPGDYVVVHVDDTGVGMSPDVLERIFEPFFTTKRAGRGTGLGLSTCHGIITQSGGRITAESKPGDGSRFTVMLPATEPSGSVVPVEAPQPVHCGNETILVVEDEEPVRLLMTRVLRGAGYVVLDAADAVESSIVVAGRAVDLLLTDLSLPGMNGIDLGIRLRNERPDLPILVVSGYAQADARLGDSRFPFLPKPFTPEELLRAVRRTLDGDVGSAGGD